MAAVEGRFCMPIKYAGVVSCAGECSYAPTCMERAVGGAAQGAVIGGIWGACICCVLHMPNSRRRSILYIYIYIYIYTYMCCRRAVSHASMFFRIRIRSAAADAGWRGVRDINASTIVFL